MDRLRWSVSNKVEKLSARLENVKLHRDKPLNRTIWLPLDPQARQFRVLRLEPSPDIRSRVCCSLKIVSLDQDVQFEAVSYTWGSRAKLVSGIVDGFVWSMYANLDSALRHMRHASEPRLLWADALCIAQDNLQEKSAQVQMLGDIFGKAKAVRVFLGEQYSGAERAFAILRAINGEENFDTLVADGKSVTANDLEILADLFERPYWARAWIVQELILAQSATLQWGFTSMDVQNLPVARDVANAFQHSMEHFRVLKSRHSWQRASYAFTDHVLPLLFVYQNLRTVGWSNQPGHNTNMLITLCQRDATVERDFIYAFRAMLWPRLRDVVIPDYIGPTEAVFRNFAFNWLQQGRFSDMSLLSYASGMMEKLPASTAVLPSWSPRFNKTIAERTYRWGSMSLRFIPNTTAQPQLQTASDGIGLLLHAHVLDQISEVMMITDSTFDKWDNDKDAPLLVNLEAYRKVYNKCRAFVGLPNHTANEIRYQGSETLLLEDAFWLTIYEGLTSDMKWLTETQVQACKRWLTKANEQNSAVHGIDLETRRLVAEISDTVESHWKGKYLFKTQIGYIGTIKPPGESQVCVGDTVVFVARASLPFVLRHLSTTSAVTNLPHAKQTSPTETSGCELTTYHLVGATYVHGCMRPALDSPSSRYMKEGESTEPATGLADQFLRAGVPDNSHPQDIIADGKWNQICLL